MTNITIYNNLGIKIDQLTISDKITYIDGRVSKGKNCYYKGVGIPYQYHNLMEFDNQYDVIEKSEVFYVGYKVIKKCFVNKTGIFQERYQHFFPDFIGACGIKEGPIVLNSTIFEKSSVDILDYVEFDRENKQSYYTLNYKCNREEYLKYGNPLKLRELIDYTIVNDWNFLWDKTSIRDISKNGLVTDVADLFISKDLNHKLGSVYSIIYSLGKLNFGKYKEFLDHNDMIHIDDRSYVFNSMKLLTLNGVDVNIMLPHKDVTRAYQNIVLNYIVNGKNCAYCACDMFAPYGDKVKKQFIENVSRSFNKK